MTTPPLATLLGLIALAALAVWLLGGAMRRS